MPLTPNEATTEKSSVGKKSWPTEDQDVVAWVTERQQKAEQRLSDWYELAREDFNFYENRQWSEDDLAKFEKEKRVPVIFNRIAPIINSICGQEVTNRQEVKFLPRRVGEVSGADPMNGAVKWLRDNCNAEDEDSDAFRDMTICGMGWTVARMEYEVNPEGEGKVERRDPLLMRWDPAARRKNLADKKWVQSDYWMGKEAIEERWPDADVTLMVNVKSPNDRASPEDVTEAWKYKNDAAGKEYFADQWRVIHHVEYFTKTVHRVMDPQTNKITTLSPEDFKKASRAAEQFGIKLESAKVPMRVYWEAWVVGGQVLDCGETKIQKGFQYECMTCTRERETGYWFGLVRLMLDPQRYANRMASLMMSILATGPKGGMLYETGAFVNPKKAKADWARWDSAIELTEGAIAGQKFKQKDPVMMPQGAAELMQFAITSIRDVTGVNIEMLGMRQEDQPGIVEDMRTKAGLTILAGVFDAMRLYRKRQGIILAEFVEKFLSDGRLIRIVGKDGQQFIPLLRNPETTEYDLVVDESPASRDVKERTFQVMQVVGPGLVQMGVPLPPETIDYLPIPESLAGEIKKGIVAKSKQPPQPPMELQKAQLQTQSAEHIAQMKAQAEAQGQMLKMQIEQAAEQARAQADIQIANVEARIKAATEQARDESQRVLEKERMQQEFALEMQKAALQAETQIRIARIAAGQEAMTPEDAAVEHGHNQLLQQVLTGHQELLKVLSAPVDYIRDPATQRIVQRVPRVQNPTVQ